MTRFFRLLFAVLVFAYFALPPYINIFGAIPLRRFISVLGFGIVFAWGIRFARFRWSIRLTTATVFFICLFFLFSASSSNVYPGVFYRTLFSVVFLISLWLAITRIFFTSNGYPDVDERSPAFFTLSIFFVHYLVTVSEVAYGFQWTLTLPAILDASDGWSFIAENKTRDGAIRYQGLSAHPLVYSVFCVLSASSIFYLRRVNKLKPIVFVSALLLIAHAVYLTGSRAGILVFLFSVLTNIFLYKKSFVKSSVILLLTSLFLVYSLISDFSWLDRIYVYVAGSGSSQAQNSNYVRYTQFLDAYKLFLESGLVLGFGMESAPRLMTYGTVDNLWLSILIEGGIIAFVLFAYIFVFAIHRSFLIKNSESRSFYLTILFSLLAFSLVLSISDIFYLVFIFIALSLTSYQRFR